MSIRTPEDERPDWLYAPFTEGWWYQGATYPGHSDFSVDWNRRTRTGGWLDDQGDPVLAMQDGTIAHVDKGDGLVMVHHHGGRTQVELRHMQDIVVKPGQKVKRGDRIGSIGNVAGDGRSFGAHLHMVQYGRKTTSEPFRRVPLTIEGKRIATSVGDSDTRPSAWNPPAPVMLQGPPPKATWESAYKEAAEALRKADQKAADAVTAKGAAEDALAQEKAAHLLTRQALDKCEARPPTDCSQEVDRALEAERKLDDIRAVLAR